MRVGPALLALFALTVAACGAGDVGPGAGQGEASPGTATTAETQPTTTTTSVPPDLGEAGTLVELDGWLQSDIESLAELRGQVVLVQFWTFGCSNCKNTLPHLQSLYADYHPQGFEIVGVHSPEFGYERDPDNITEAAGELGVTWPIALDTEKRNFFGWQGSPAYWPRTYVIDQNGRVRFDHIGEGKYDEIRATVASLLAGT